MLTVAEHEYARDWAQRTSHAANVEASGIGYLAHSTLIPGAVGVGDDPATARHDLMLLANEYAHGVLERGDELPEPTRADTFTLAPVELPT